MLQTIKITLETILEQLNNFKTILQTIKTILEHFYKQLKQF